MSRRLFVEFTCDRCGLIEHAESEQGVRLYIGAERPPKDWRVLGANNTFKGLEDRCPKCAEVK